jgi:hypothetical protein
MRNTVFSGIGLAASLAAALAIGLLAETAHAAEAVNSSILRTASGTLEYRKIATGAVTGAERWSLVVHPDGSRTLNTANRIDAAGLQRNVVLTVDKDFRPRSLFASFWLGGAWVGTALMSTAGSRLTVVASTPHGRMTQDTEVPDRFAFIPHPPAANAWQVGAYDRARGGVQRVPLYDLQTRLAGPGNMFGALTSTPMEYLGVARIDVPAGRFDADHYRSGESEVWVHGPDAIIVRFVWNAVGEEYVLTSLQQGR